MNVIAILALSVGMVIAFLCALADQLLLSRIAERGRRDDGERTPPQPLAVPVASGPLFERGSKAA